MKNIERDFIIIGSVPDDTQLNDCEVIIHKCSVSYPTPEGTVTHTYNDSDEHPADDPDIIVLSTRFVNPNTGEELESD